MAGIWAILTFPAAAAVVGSDAGPMAHADRIQLPEILSDADVAHYRAAFEAQSHGDWKSADQELARLADRRLVGVLLADRYLARTTRIGYGELVGWLERYADLPDAGRIHGLAMHAKPAHAPAPPRPTATAVLAGLGDVDGLIADPVYTPRIGNLRAALVTAERIRAELRRGDAGAARLLLERAEADADLDPAAVDQWRAEVAHALLAAGQDRAAYGLARQAADRSGTAVVLAPWVAGLAAWKLDRRDQARDWFEQVARSPLATPWRLAAAAFWAARANLVTRRPEAYGFWMARAAAHPATFYGILAERALGREIDLSWNLPAFGRAEQRRFASLPGVGRALALIQLGERGRADDELRHVYPRTPTELQPLLLTVAERGGMPALALRIAGQLRLEGRRYDAGLYPVPPWVPATGYRINRAILFAIARQESGFNPGALSPAGATGIMQLMPRTARALADSDRQAQEALSQPASNLTVGQRYVDLLLGHDRVRGNLFHMAAAYNGGTGKLAQMQDKGLRTDDPLLFVEAIPVIETRLFVQRVLTNFWIYQLRFGQTPDSLDALAAGEWPVYTDSDVDEELAEQNGRN